MIGFLTSKEMEPRGVASRRRGGGAGHRRGVEEAAPRHRGGEAGVHSGVEEAAPRRREEELGVTVRWMRRCRVVGENEPGVTCGSSVSTYQTPPMYFLR